jgi:hypothetical protein
MVPGGSSSSSIKLQPTGVKRILPTLSSWIAFDVVCDQFKLLDAKFFQNELTVLLFLARPYFYSKNLMRGIFSTLWNTLKNKLFR